MQIHTAENLTEGDEVEMTMEFEGGSKAGKLKVTKVNGRSSADVEDADGNALTLNFAGQHVNDDEYICTLMRNGKKMATITELEGY